MEDQEGKAQRIERREERLEPRVSVNEAGRLRVHRRVAEEREELEVELRHHEVDVDRVPVDRPLGAGEQPLSRSDDETLVLVIEERLEVRRVPWVVEEIRLRRRVVTDKQHISEPVRREEVEIDLEGRIGSRGQ